MSFSSYEESEHNGRPVEFYQFDNGSSSWFYTSAVENKTYQGQEYTACPISREEVQFTSEINKNSINIYVPVDHPIYRLHIGIPPSSTTTVIITKAHLPDLDIGEVEFFGRILNVGGAVDGIRCPLYAENMLTSMRRMGLRRKYQRECPLLLYGQGPGECGVDKTDPAFSVSTTVNSLVDSLTLSVAASLTAHHFEGGFMEWDTAAGVQKRFILSNATHTVKVNFPFSSVPSSNAELKVGDSVRLYLGCQHTLTDCHDKFNNMARYGGFPRINLTNPFGGTTLY